MLRHKSFDQLTEEELAEVSWLAAQIGLAVPERRTRRRRPGAAGAPDVRRTLRRALRSGGEPVDPAWRERRPRRRRLVLVLDVSRSMRDHARGLLAVAHGALRHDRRWEAFCFGTRLTRVTRALDTSRPELALERAAAEVMDWDGGTRIGESLKAFSDRYGHAGVARGAVLVLASDGLDVGDPALLAAEMQRLSRLAHQIVWLNPLAASASFEPLTRGMRAALPFVDVFASGHDLDSVAAALARRPPGTRRGLTCPGRRRADPGPDTARSAGSAPLLEGALDLPARVARRDVATLVDDRLAARERDSSFTRPSLKYSRSGTSVGPRWVTLPISESISPLWRSSFRGRVGSWFAWVPAS